MMTPRERHAHRLIQKILRENGYPTYADIFNIFDLELTSNPGCTACMIPGKGIIKVNVGLNADQISVVVRHEILHEYLQHMYRLLKKLNAPSLEIWDYKNEKKKPEDLTLKDLMDLGYNNKIANYAMDYDISNQGYTEEDKDIVRQITVNGKVVGGLVTEDDHEDWVNLTMEEMYDKLMQDPPMPPTAPQQPDPPKKKRKTIRGKFINDTTFECEDGTIINL